MPPEYDEHQIRGQCQVDQIELVDQEIVPPHGWHVDHQDVQIGEETVDEQRKAANQAQQKRCHQPTAEEDHRLSAAPGMTVCFAASIGRYRGRHP